jgi:hypothetical protein
MNRAVLKGWKHVLPIASNTFRGRDQSRQKAIMRIAEVEDMSRFAFIRWRSQPGSHRLFPIAFLKTPSHDREEQVYNNATFIYTEEERDYTRSPDEIYCVCRAGVEFSNDSTTFSQRRSIGSVDSTMVRRRRIWHNWHSESYASESATNVLSNVAYIPGVGHISRVRVRGDGIPLYSLTRNAVV